MEVRSVEAIVSALNKAGAKYLIVGGVAVNAHGFVRLTRDVDIVLLLDQGNVNRGLSALFNIGYQMSIAARPEDFANPETREDWRQSKGMITLKLWSDEHQRTPIDIFVYEPFDFAKEFANAMTAEVCPGLLARVVSWKHC
jgi:hypothetical protein